MRRLLSRRGLVIAGLVVVVGLGAVAAWRWVSGPKKEPTALQIMARAPAQEAAVVVGPNVQVSKDNGSIPHRECVVAADPSHPERLAAFAIYDPPGSKSVPKTAGYRSEDGGKSWSLAFERKDLPNEAMYDPAVAFGPDGVLHYVCMSFPDAVRFTRSHGDTLDSGGLVFFRSPDGGKTWEPPSTVPQFTDRPWLAVDGSRGKYRSRLYCEGNLSTSVPLGTPAVPALKFVLHTSKDEGVTFATSRTWLLKNINQDASFTNGNAVVLSDGTVAFVCIAWSNNHDERPQVRLVLSDDGGESLHEGVPVGTYWYDPDVKSSNFFFPPQAAADTTGPDHLDRLHVVWEDGPEPNRVRILTAYSPDKGRSWVGPTILSEQPAGAARDKDYGAFLPSIAVNKAGVVAATWYDRRGLPDVKVTKGVYPPGCNVRMRVSLDGGQTWQPSVQVNEQPIQASCDDFKDTAGIAADAAGDFHPVWIDDRTGTRQVWTATVSVRAK